jgi:uncharacterized protein (DUF2249 family)
MKPKKAARPNKEHRTVYEMLAALKPGNWNIAIEHYPEFSGDGFGVAEIKIEGSTVFRFPGTTVRIWPK